MTISCNSDNFRYKVFDCPVQNSKVSQLIALLKDPQVQSFLKVIVDNAIATSELRILKRLAAVEQILGLEDYGLDETRAPTLPQKLTEIENKVIALTKEQKPNLELPKSLPTMVTDLRTDFLIKHLQQSEDIPRVSSRGIELPFVNSREFKAFVFNILPDQLRPKNYKNLRKIKKDIFENAVERYSDKVIIDKSQHGNKEIRLIALPGVTG
jgi:hypothetical protein